MGLIYSEDLILGEQIEDLILDIRNGKSNDKLRLLSKIKEYSEDVFVKVIRRYIEKNLIPISDLGQANIDNIGISNIRVIGERIHINSMNYSFNMSDIDIDLIDEMYSRNKNGVVDLGNDYKAIWKQTKETENSINRIITGIISAQKVPVYKLEGSVIELLKGLNLDSEEENQRIKELVERNKITEEEAKIKLLNDSVEIAKSAIEILENARIGLSRFLSNSVVKLGNLKEKFKVLQRDNGKVSILENTEEGIQFVNTNGDRIFDGILSKNKGIIATKVGNKVILQDLEGTRSIEWEEEEGTLIDEEMYYVAYNIIRYGHTGKLIRTEGKEKGYGKFKICKEKQEGKRKLMYNYYYDSKGYFNQLVADDIVEKKS